jgi:hypothetical protein
MDLTTIRDIVTIAVPVIALISMWAMMRATVASTAEAIKRLEDLPEIVARNDERLSNVEQRQGEISYEVRETHNKTIELGMSMKALHERFEGRADRSR